MKPNTMLATITTKYAGPTGSKGSSIHAVVLLQHPRLDDEGRYKVRVSWDHSLGVEDNHRQAAFAVLAKAGLIRGDYDLEGWSANGWGHWCARKPAAPVHAPVIAGADDLRLVIEDLACYALVGWEEEMEDDRPEELAEWKARVDAALKAVGSKYTYAELKPLLG